MKRTFLSLLTATLLAGGCAGKPAAPLRVYDFGLAPQVATPQLSVHVEKPEAPEWLDRKEMLYRLSYRNAQALEPYAYSRWAGTPPAMLALRMRQAFGAVAPRDARCTLRVSLQEFSQVYASERSSRAVLEAAAAVHELGGEKRLAYLPLRLERETSTPDATGGAEAFAGLASELTTRLRDWIVETGYCG
jgi:cholesterol transport system auxiliary component